MKTKTKRPDKSERRSTTPPAPTVGSVDGGEATAEVNAAFGETREEAESNAAPLPPGLQRTREVSIEDVEREEDADTYSPMATGRLDTDEMPDIDNPQGAQGLRGPLNQEGQGNRQDSEAAELEQVEPDLDPYKSPR